MGAAGRGSGAPCPRLRVKGREEGRAGSDSVASVCGDGGEAAQRVVGKKLGLNLETQTTIWGEPPGAPNGPEGQRECDTHARAGNADFKEKVMKCFPGEG